MSKFQHSWTLLVKTDQGIRMDLVKLQQQGKTNTEEVKELNIEMKTQDSINEKKVMKF